MAISLATSLWVVRFCAASFAHPDASKWEYAYVSESPHAYRFHYSRECDALRRTSYEVDALSPKEAESHDYTPCKLCLKNSVRYQWDDWAIFLFFPIFGLFVMLIGKMDKFIQSYKFQSPIVRRHRPAD